MRVVEATADGLRTMASGLRGVLSERDTALAGPGGEQSDERVSRTLAS